MTRDFSEQYCDFLELNGHRVIRTPSSFWIDVRPWIFQTAPPFNFDQIHTDEVDEVFKMRNVLVCRWFSAKCDSLQADAGGDGPILYAAHPPYDLSKLDQKARNQTRRGLERVEIRRVDLDEKTERLAYSVYSDNVKRLGLLKAEKHIKNRWQAWVNTIRKAGCVEFWCAWQQRSLAAFTVAVRTAQGTELVLLRSSYSALSLYPNNALVYTVTKDALERGSQLVSFGLSAFSGDKEGLHRFKINMGFKAFPLYEHHQWHPWMRPLVPLLNPQRLRNAYRKLSGILPR